jgi:hypothetical protein
MEEDEWQCGDCKTTYSAKVKYCKKPKLDQLALEKWREGFLAGLHQGQNTSMQIEDALQIVAQLGFKIIYEAERE